MTMNHRWTHTICCDCWDKRNPSRPTKTEHRTHDSGVTERCCYCGTDTSNGIYVRDSIQNVICDTFVGDGEVMQLDWESVNLGENSEYDMTDALGSVLDTTAGRYSVIIGVCKACGDPWCSIMAPNGLATHSHQGSVTAAMLWAMLTLTDLVASSAVLN